MLASCQALFCINLYRSILPKGTVESVKREIKLFYLFLFRNLDELENFIGKMMLNLAQHV